MTSLLIIDLGGTKSRVGLFEFQEGRENCVFQKNYRNEQFAGIAEVIEAFYRDSSRRADVLCIALAGVVEGDTATLTNLDWRLEKGALQQRFSFEEILFINDLKALAASVPHLKDDEVVVLKTGEADPEEAAAVIAPGTGLGQGFLFFRDQGILARGSEGGHAGFSPQNDEELRFAGWMMQRSKAVSAEQACAGPGITLLYRFFTENEGLEPVETARRNASGVEDLAPVVVLGAAADPPCPVCMAVLNRYLAMLGSEASNLALKLYARGGVYIGGGVILHLLEAVSLEPFVQAFGSNEKMAELLAAIPVYIIRKEDAHLYGALHFAAATLGLATNRETGHLPGKE